MTRLHPGLALLALALLAPPAHAQLGGADTTVTVALLRAPEAPGALLLGGAPSAVEAPGSIRALAVSTFTRATEGDLFDAVTVQVAPFWLGGIANLSYADYEAGTRNPVEAVRRTLSVSAATDRLDLGLATPAPAVALGARASLLVGAVDRDYQGYGARRDSAVAALRRATTTFRTAVEVAQRGDPELQRLEREIQAATPAQRRALIQARSDRETAVARRVDLAVQAEAADVIGTLPERRRGASWDLAGAWAVVFPGSDFDDAETYRWGLWTTAGYTGPSATLLAVARYLGQPGLFGGSSETVADLGGRLLWDAPQGGLTLSAEGVYRVGLSGGAADRYRVSGELSYALAPDRALSFTLGRDFDGEPSGNVLALLRLVAQFGNGVSAPSLESPLAP
ncbi:hypothetical protein [Rubrivirga sp. IMCC45206]|uniref:hypothetical protein n=1 Tax=Rubrivirga sp. IMCC45206 TaxID=3391614 RepID=UPI00398F9C46